MQSIIERIMQLHTGKQPVCAGITDSIGLLYVANHHALRRHSTNECVRVMYSYHSHRKDRLFRKPKQVYAR